MPVTNKTPDLVELDLLLCGTIIPAGERQSVRMDYEGGPKFSLPLLSGQDIAHVRAQVSEAKRRLDDLTIRDVAEFLSKLGKYWIDVNSTWRAFADRYAPSLTGYHPHMLANDYFLFAEFIAAKSSIYDQVRGELGNEHIFDEWIPEQAAFQRAYGLDFAVHVLVGNLPLAGLYSLVRSVMARNVCLAKLPARDPVSTYGLVRAMIEIAPDHPITRSMSLGYWERGSVISSEALQSADVIVAWGGGEGIRAIAVEAAGRPMVIFGPKWSLAIIDGRKADPDQAALRLAFEVGYYDQEACFSTQHLFVIGDPSALIARMQSAFSRFTKVMPLVTSNMDVLAHKSASCLEADFRGWRTVQSGDFTIVCVPPGEMPAQSPLTRTLYVHEVSSVEQAARAIDRNTQTVSVFPWSLAHDYRDVLGQAGAERIVELGMSRHPRQGFTHDGMRWLNHLVRIVSVERPSTQPYKYNNLTKEELPYWLFEKPLGIASHD